MELNEELRKRHGITRITSLHHAELTPAMLPQSIGHYRGWIYDKNSFTLDQVRAFVYNACIYLRERRAHVRASDSHGGPPTQDPPIGCIQPRNAPVETTDALTTCSIHREPILSAEEERTHVASIGTVLERVLVCMPLKVSLPMLDAARNQGLYDIST